jgi:hypothetical protein
MHAKYSLIAALLIGSGPVWAHDAKGPHGGQITDAGSFHVEMVVKSAFVDVFISDASETPIAATGYKGTAILVAAGKSQRIVLEPADGGRLTGKATAAFNSQPKGVVQLTAPDGKTIQGKFD